MKTWSQQFISQGYNSGKSDGIREGYDSGKTDGIKEGYDSGKTDGIREGKADGLKEGYNNGKAAGAREIAKRLMTDQANMPDKKISSITGLSLKNVKDIRKSLETN